MRRGRILGEKLDIDYSIECRNFSYMLFINGKYQGSYDSIDVISL